jgi:hypothetical protein
MSCQKLSPKMTRPMLFAVFAALLITCGASKPHTYSETLKTYPKDAELCPTEASIEPDGEDLRISGNIQFREGDSLLASNLINVIRCYGTRVTINGTVTIEGETYESGTLLTVDTNLHWVEVSSWD